MREYRFKSKTKRGSNWQRLPRTELNDDSAINKTHTTQTILIELVLTKNPRTPMISIVYENMVIRATVDDFPASPCKCSFVSKYDGKEVSDSYIFPSIILEEKKVKNFSPKENKYVALNQERINLAIRGMGI